MVTTKIPAEVLAHTTFTIKCNGCGKEHVIPYEQIMEGLEASLLWKAEVMPSKGIEIEYLSGSREVSRRTIIPQTLAGIWIDGRRQIRDVSAFCTMRKATRTFIADRIKVAFDAETGESVDPTEWLLARLKT